MNKWKPLYSQDSAWANAMMKALKPKIIFDAGCNEGGFINSALELKPDEIVGFEPVPAMFQKCYRRFHIDSRVTVRNVGVAERDYWQQDMNVYNAWSLAPNKSRRDIALEFSEKKPFEVHFITMDSLGIQPDLIKLDVDGYEFRALRGAEQILKSHPPIHFEFSTLPRKILGDDMGLMCEWIYEHGYSAVSLDGWRCPDAKIMMSMIPEDSSYDILLMP